MNGLHPTFATRLARLQGLLEQHGLRMRITCGYRSLAQQVAEYAKGRTAPGPRVTRARPGRSPHNYGLAADFCFQGLRPYDGDWKAFGRLAKQAGLAWGGGWLLFKDRPHVELPRWRTHIPKKGGSKT